jgi:hypothetical protein
MEDKLARFLDYCLERIKNGETIEQCLAEHPALRSQIEPLLRSALAVSSLPKVAVSERYRETAIGRLIARLHQETGCNKVVELDQQTSFKDNFTRVRQWLHQYFIGAKRLAIPVALAVIIAIGASISAFSWMSPSSAMASVCTLSIYNGNVEILVPGQEGSQPGADGMTLDVGTRIITAPDTEALITFFDGSTLELESETDIEIQRLVSDDEQNISIVLKQWMGKTWSRVVKMADPHYEIQTPSAAAIVRGTIFMVEVDETGETTVVTNEGLVSVVGEDAEVFVPAGWETKVKRGATPAFPFNTPATKADHQLPENAAAPPFNGGLPDNAKAPPFNGELPDNAAAPARGELPDNAAAPARGELPDNAAPPARGELPDNAAPPTEGALPGNAAPPAGGTLPGNAAPPAGGTLPGNAAAQAQGNPHGQGNVPPGWANR